MQKCVVVVDDLKHFFVEIRGLFEAQGGCYETKADSIVGSDYGQ